MTAQAQPTLARLRRQTATQAIHIIAALIGRPTPWRDWEPISQQLRTVGFHDIFDPEQTEHELTLMHSFLLHWLDLLDMTDGIIWSIWSDDDDEHV
jgi:hypothetical protein